MQNYDTQRYGDNMNILYAADDNYAPILGISLLSLLENNKTIDDIKIYIFENEITESNKKKIDYICESYNRAKPHWILSRNIQKELNVKLSVDRGSFAQYARLFVTELPADLERVLYIDCDTIINQSLYDLWNMDIHGKTIAALQDCFSKQYRKNIGLRSNDIIFNSGVLLIDLIRWREKNIEERMIQFIQKTKGHIQQGDQGILNAALSRDCYLLEPKYNAVTYYFDFNYKELLTYRKPIAGYYTKNQIKEAVTNPVIIHFTTSWFSKRPWEKNGKHHYDELWEHYKGKSPWNSMKKKESIMKWYKRVGIGAFQILPRPLAIWIAGVFQAYIRPWKNVVILKRSGIFLEN